MSQPTGGSWNNGQGGSLGQNWGGSSEQDAQGQGSLGQNWGSGSEQSSGGQGSPGQGWDASGSQESNAQTQQWGGESSGSNAGQQSAYGQGSYNQGDYGQQSPGQSDYGQQSSGQSGYGATAHQSQGGGFQTPKAAGEGIGALFSDLKFTRSLTEGLAQLTFLGVVVWAVLKFLANTIHNFGSTDFGGADLKNMGTFDAVMHLFADLVWLVLVVAIVRIVLELAINVAKLAKNRD